MRKNDPSFVEAVPGRVDSSHTPHALVPNELRAQIIRLTQSLLKELPGGTSRRIMFTGAGPKVGTSFTVRAVSDVGAELGYIVESQKLEDGASEVAVPHVHRTNLPTAAGEAEPSQVSLFPKRIEQPAFDLLLLDSPPIVESAVAMRCSGLAEGVVLVVTAGDTMEREIRRALDTIEVCGGKCLGLVLNRRPRSFFRRG
jgi:hypothetical protein